MLKERVVHPNLKSMLLANEPFSYAHLIKFERPSRPDASGRTSTSKERYAYLCDASRDVDYDDGSRNLAGTPNGTQTYLANKVLRVSSVSEQTEAKANTFSLTLDGNGIGAIATDNVTITSVDSNTWDIAWPQNTDLVRIGFREGDKVTLSGIVSSDVSIRSFRANNVLRVGKIDTAISTGSGSLTMALSSDEIKSILLDKTAGGYSSFINREVFIYRAYFKEGQLVGAPITLFKGIISNVSFEDTDTSIQVTWGLTNHWGDFAQVRGRITSDEFHRALDSNGIPQPQSSLKPAYAYDKGFSHAETSINILAKYTVQVEKQDVKVKKGFLGIGSKVKVKKYFANEDRNTELDFQLQAKSIPIVYGVRNVEGIPIFADTLNDDTSTVYVAYALSEGEIGAIYDTYVDGNSLICNNKADFDARSIQTGDNTVQLICRGRADRGDVIGGTSSIDTSTTTNFYSADDIYLLTDLNYNYTSISGYYNYVAPTVTVTDTSGRGVVDGESISLTSPQKITMDFFSGKPGQKASTQLVAIADAKNFKIQNAYWVGKDTAEYWGPNHRLLDTAYVVVMYKIEEGETTIPSLSFIIKGKAVNCYNYDYSYSHYTKSSTESADNFKLGDTVSLYDMNSNVLNSSVQIIDKWTLVNPDGTNNVRFRFNSPPNLGYVEGIPAITKFYMRNSSGQTWTMVTYNYEEYNGTVGTTAATTATGVSNAGGYVAIDVNPFNFNGGDPNNGGIPSVSLDRYDSSLSGSLFGENSILRATSASTYQYVTSIPYSSRTALAAQQALA